MNWGIYRYIKNSTESLVCPWPSGRHSAYSRHSLPQAAPSLMCAPVANQWLRAQSFEKEKACCPRTSSIHPCQWTYKPTLVGELTTGGCHGNSQALSAGAARVRMFCCIDFAALGRTGGSESLIFNTASEGYMGSISSIDANFRVQRAQIDTSKRPL